MTAFALAAAYLLDRFLGDPRGLPHPVVLIGRWASSLERILRPPRPSPARELAGGCVLVASVTGAAAAAAWLVVEGMGRVHALAGLAAEVWLVATALAARGLDDAASEVASRLEAGDLEAARRSVAGLVARSTERLDAGEVSRAAVESVAENLSDGFVAPLFYAALGGAPLALAYKAVNTLDSMFGYRDRSNLYFGRAAARLDDAANWIPARLSAGLVVVAAWLTGFHARAAWRTVRKQARNHPSPNAGYPEAAMAGALGVRLGGVNHYPEGRSFRPYLGEPRRPLQPERIREAVRILRAAALAATILSAAVLLLTGRAVGPAAGGWFGSGAEVSGRWP